MDLLFARRQALIFGALVIGPLFGAIVDLLYLVILLLSIGNLRWTRSILVSALLCLTTAFLLFMANPQVEAPFFSYFFFRLALLLLLFGGSTLLCREPASAQLYSLFLIYVGAVIYQYLGLPGSETLQVLHADKIVDEGLSYRASGLFSGFFSAATVIGSLGIVLLMRSSLPGALLVLLGMVIVAFCSGRSIIIYVAVGLVALAWRAPRIAAGVVLLLCGVFLIGFLQLTAIASDNSDVAASFVLFMQVWSILGGDVGGTSTEALLLDQYYLPSGLVQWLIGNNERPFTVMGVMSDSGYMQLLFGMGLIGSFVYLTVIGVFLMRRATNTTLALMVAMVLVSFKGNAFIAIGVLDLLFLLSARTATGVCAEPRRITFGRVVGFTPGVGGA